MKCEDVNCPIHGELPTRGMVFDGMVVSDKMDKTVVVERQYFVKVRKYDRFKRARSKIPAHNPPCLNVKTGDRVRIMECRKLSKTVSFVVTEKIDEKEKSQIQDKKIVKTKKKPVKSKPKAESKKKKVKEVENG